MGLPAMSFLRAVLACLAYLVLPASSEEATTVKLNNGLMMPKIAFGANIWDAATCHQATEEALKAGFRFVWSSALIHAACQKAQGQAIKGSGIPRTELFIAGTVDTKTCKGEEACYASTKNAASQQFQYLDLDVLDMLMLDYPSESGCNGIRGQWQAFEEIYVAKLVKTIAVSNFSPAQLQCLLSNHSVTIPSVNQMPYYVGKGKDSVISDNQQFGIVVQAWSPLNSGQVISDSRCVKIGKAHGKSAAQVALRWILQNGGTINTQSTSLKHMQEDIDVFDFTLSAAEMEQLDAELPYVV